MAWVPVIWITDDYNTEDATTIGAVDMLQQQKDRDKVNVDRVTTTQVYDEKGDGDEGPIVIVHEFDETDEKHRGHVSIV